jgi:hypothetical protein
MVVRCGPKGWLALVNPGAISWVITSDSDEGTVVGGVDVDATTDPTLTMGPVGATVGNVVGDTRALRGTGVVVVVGVIGVLVVLVELVV